MENDDREMTSWHRNHHLPWCADVHENLKGRARLHEAVTCERSSTANTDADDAVC